jgi:hypothetical protein
MLAPSMKTPVHLAITASMVLLAGCSSTKSAGTGAGTPATGAAAGSTPSSVPKGGIALPSACSEEGRGGEPRSTDVDNDGRPEVIKYYQEVDDPERPGTRKTALVRQDIDLNWDGKLDVCRTFSPAGLALKEEVDLDYDGRIDEVRYYEDGVIARSERDRNNDGRADVIRRYKSGKLVQKEVDTNDDGQPDRWEYFDGDKLERVGIDVDYDGKVDRWSKAS